MNTEFKYAVTATTYNGKRKIIKRFREHVYANRFKNLLKVTKKEFPSKKSYKNPRIKKL